MYRENRKSINAQVGCRHKCVYCTPSFQRQAKRQKNRCWECYFFNPHFHSERLLKAPPKTKGDEFVFFPSMGDPAFANSDDIEAMIAYAREYPNTKFLMQTKAPAFLYDHDFPTNIILGITLETDKKDFDTPSLYKTYGQISSALEPASRAREFVCAQPQNRIVTIEPILQFDLNEFVVIIRSINPQVVYVGYDNHN